MIKSHILGMVTSDILSKYLLCREVTGEGVASAVKSIQESLAREKDPCVRARLLLVWAEILTNDQLEEVRDQRVDMYSHCTQNQFLILIGTRLSLVNSLYNRLSLVNTHNARLLLVNALLQPSLRLEEMLSITETSSRVLSAWMTAIRKVVMAHSLGKNLKLKIFTLASGVLHSSPHPVLHAKAGIEIKIILF